MTTELIVITTTSLFFLASLVAIVVLVVRTPRKSKDSRLEALSARETHLSAASRRSGQSGSRISLTSSSQRSTQTANRMVQAGLYRRNTTARYYFVKLLFALAPIVLGLVATLLGFVPLSYGVGIGVIVGILGTLLPSFWLDSKKKSRQTSISRALPDALDVIVVCLEAGLSLRAAVSRVAKELAASHPLLAAELLIAEREIQLGCSGGEAFKRFADRFDMETLRSLASVIMQAEKFGASIAHALRVHADGLRVKRFQMAEELAQKASIKLLFPTMFLIFPTLYVVLLGPAVIEMVDFFTNFGPG